MVGTWLGQDTTDRMVKHAGADAQGHAVAREQGRGDRAMMAEVQGSTAGHVRVGRIVTAVATGALLGALAAMPYDQLLGISVPASMILRSVLTTAVWAGLRSEQPHDLNFNADTTEAGAPKERGAAGKGRNGSPGGWRNLKGNLVRFQNVLKVRAGSILAHCGG
jgi:hypothetical protein